MAFIPYRQTLLVLPNSSATGPSVQSWGLTLIRFIVNWNAFIAIRNFWNQRESPITP